MTKNKLIAEIASHHGLPRTVVSNILNSAFHKMADALVEGREVKILDFGLFSTAARPARQGRDPRNGRPISVPPTRTVRFAVGKGLKEALNDTVS